MNDSKCMIVILDGFGYSKKRNGNAPMNAKMPFYNSLLKKYSHSFLKTDSGAVGLPPNTMGNSEVGHITIGSGRIINQDLVRITKSIEDKSFFKNKVLLSSVSNVKKHSSNLHIMGLLSDGSIHSHIDHLFGLLDFVKKQKVKRVYLHIFTDGRDTDIYDAPKFVKKLESKIKSLKLEKKVSIATVSGRYFAMDRNKNWNRTKSVYDLIVNKKGMKDLSAKVALTNSYLQGESDEFITPTLVDELYPGLQKNDSLIFFNFRPDRVRQITNAFTSRVFSGFKRKFTPIHFTAMTKYNIELKKACIAFPHIKIKNTIGEVISKKKLKQLRIAETEKYAHVTYFLNGGSEDRFNGEKRILIPSPKVATYDKKPEMSCKKVTDVLLKELEKNYSFICLNYTNPDMVGHTGKFKAAIKSLESVDKELRRLVRKALLLEYNVLIFADHGNCEEMLNPDGSINTRHSKNPVRLVLASNSKLKVKNGGLSDISPTVLDILGIKQPKEMTGKSLIKK